MGRKTLISIVLSTVALLAAAVAAYAIDSANENKISEGVRVSGISLGGLEADAARKVIRQTVVDPYSKDIEVRAGGKKFVLNSKRIDIRADIDGMVAEAIRVSRDGNLPSRVWREVTGGEVDHQITPKVEFDTEAVDEFVEKVSEVVDTDPVDASVQPTATSLQPIDGSDGAKLQGEKLRKEILAQLENPNDSGTIKAAVETIEPEVTTEELAAQYPTYILVDRANFRLHFYENLQLTKTYTVAIGAAGHDTPTGLYHIQNKAVDPTWNVPDSDWAGELAGELIPPGPDNPLKARWMGIANGVGIHGTADEGSLGSAASKGCIRMSVFDVKDLYDKVPTGTPIYIS